MGSHVHLSLNVKLHLSALGAAWSFVLACKISKFTSTGDKDTYCDKCIIKSKAKSCKHRMDQSPDFQIVLLQSDSM